MRALVLAAIALGGCRGDGGAGGSSGSGSAAAVVPLRARPAEVATITIKALGIT